MYRYVFSYVCLLLLQSCATTRPSCKFFVRIFVRVGLCCCACLAQKKWQKGEKYGFELRTRICAKVCEEGL